MDTYGTDYSEMQTKKQKCRIMANLLSASPEKNSFREPI